MDEAVQPITDCHLQKHSKKLSNVPRGKKKHTHKKKKKTKARTLPCKELGSNYACDLVAEFSKRFVHDCGFLPKLAMSGRLSHLSNKPVNSILRH